MVGGSSSKMVRIPSSSVTLVLSNHDLLFEILLHLPVLSLMLFKSVSKQWCNIITSPRFMSRRRKLPTLDPPFGLITHLSNFADRVRCNFESFDIRVPSRKSIGFTLGLKASLGPVTILQSCNGLLLCRCYSDKKFYVCNPTINRFKMIRTKIDTSNHRVKIAFDPRKSPHYKIVQVKDFIIGSRLNRSNIALQTYRSETGTWSVFGDYSILTKFDGFEEGVYWNDVIYWLNPFNLFKPRTFYFKLDIQCEVPVLTELELPETFNLKSYFQAKLFEFCGCLLLVGLDRALPYQLNVYEMMHGSIKYVVNLYDIMMPWTPPQKLLSDIVVSCIVLGERQEDSFMLIELEGKVVQYNLVSKTVHTLDDLVSLGWQPFCTVFKVFQCIPSFALV